MRKRYLFTAIASAILPLLFKSVATAQQAAPGDNERLAAQAEPAVVRIVDGCFGTYVYNDREYDQSAGGIGSGFFINSNGYIATNAHVTEFGYKGENSCRETLFARFLREVAQQDSRLSQLLNSSNPLTRRDAVALMRQESRLKDFEFVHHVILPNPNQDPVAFEIKSYGETTGQNNAKDVAIIKIDIENTPSLQMAENSNQVRIQDHVTVVGYPAAADDFDNNILSRGSFFEASFTDGRISARRNLASGTPILQISAPATNGNSGGPVLNNQGEVIGMPTFTLSSNGQQVSGFTFVIPTNTIMEFVRQAGTTNEQGVVDEVYREGLELFFNGQYQEAIARFEEIRNLFRPHSEADRLIQESQQAISTGRGSSSTNPTPSPTPTNSPTQISSGNSGLNNFLRNIPPWGVPLLIALLVGIPSVVLLMRRNRISNQSNQSTYGNDYPPPNTPPASPPPQPSPIPHFSTQPQNFGSGSYTVPNVQSFPSTVREGFGNDTTFTTQVTHFGSLTCTSGILAGKTFPIPPEGLSIGRDRTCQVVIDDPRISKEHLWIGLRNNSVIAIDKKSSNGTFLNKTGYQRINEVFLKPGDELILADGVVKFLYNAPSSTVSNQTITAVKQNGDRTVVETARLGTITFTSGALIGQKFEIPPTGLCIGRDRQAQIVIDDHRVSKQHLWIVPRDGRVAVVDKGSTNGAYLNQLSSERIKDVVLNSGDTIILCEGDVARFQYQDDKTTIENKPALALQPSQNGTTRT